MHRVSAEIQAPYDMMHNYLPDSVLRNANAQSLIWSGLNASRVRLF